MNTGSALIMHPGPINQLAGYKWQVDRNRWITIWATKDTPWKQIFYGKFSGLRKTLRIMTEHEQTQRVNASNS